MSVPQWRRSESKMEYVKVGMDLVKYTTQKCLKLPKRLTFFISTDLVKTAQDIYKDVIYIKTLYSTTSEHETKRKELVESVVAKLEYLASMLNILFAYAETTFTENQWSKWTELIEREIALLKGIKNKN